MGRDEVGSAAQATDPKVRDAARARSGDAETARAELAIYLVLAVVIAAEVAALALVLC